MTREIRRRSPKLLPVRKYIPQYFTNPSYLISRLHIIHKEIQCQQQQLSSSGNVEDFAATQDFSKLDALICCHHAVAVKTRCGFWDGRMIEWVDSRDAAEKKET